MKKLWDKIKIFFSKLRDNICSIDKKKLAIYAIIEIVDILWLVICYVVGAFIGKTVAKIGGW